MKRMFGLLLTILITTSVFAEVTKPFRKYYDNGTPKLFGYHLLKTGQRHGKWISYDKDGTVRQVLFYDNGRRSIGNYDGEKKTAGISTAARFSRLQ